MKICYGIAKWNSLVLLRNTLLAIAITVTTVSSVTSKTISTISSVTVGIHPNHFEIHPNPIPTGHVMYNCQAFLCFYILFEKTLLDVLFQQMPADAVGCGSVIDHYEHLENI